MSTVTRVEFVSERMSFIVLKVCWYNIIVFNVYAVSKEKSDDPEDSFYEKLEKVFDHFPKRGIKVL